MGDISFYTNVEDFSFSLSSEFDTPVENPLRFAQGLDILIDQYFVEPTGNPSNPWNYVDPVDFTEPQLCLAQLNQSVPPYLALSVAPTYFSGSEPYLEYLMSFNTSQITAALGSSPSLKAVFEADWMNGSRQFVVQTDCFISRSALATATPSPTPIPSSFTINQNLAAGATSATFDLSSYNLTSPPLNIWATLIRSNGEAALIAVYPQIWTATSFTCALSAPTPDGTYVCSILVIP